MKPRVKKAGRALALLAGAIAIAAPAGCLALSDGLDPPPDRFYYPTAIVTSPGKHTLYVINSDFDIQYTGGTVQAVDLDKTRRCVLHLGGDLANGLPAADACRGVGLASNANPVIYPGPCAPLDIAASFTCGINGKEPFIAGQLVKSSRIIGAFASSAALVVNPDPGPDDTIARLFVAVRGDPSITYFDVSDDRTEGSDPFRLDCKSDGDAASLGGRCGQSSRIGTNPYDSTRLEILPTEPVGLAASDNGQAIVAAQQTGGAASLIFNDWSLRPSLEFIATGMPDSPSGIAAIPQPALVDALAKASPPVTVDYRPGFLVTLRGARELDMLRFYNDEKGTSRHFLQRVASFSIATNSDGGDSRGVAIDASERRECEAGCGADVACLQVCLDTPLKVYIANRSPSSLLIGKLETHIFQDKNGVTGLVESVNINEMVPLTSGPSRVAIGRVLDEDGHPSTRVFTVSFDSRYVSIYDPRQHRVEATVRTGRGPHAMAFDLAEPTFDADGKLADPGHALLYVAHFTDSYIGAVDLDTRNVRTYGSMIATIGAPTSPKESN